jgi:hypothetical protein
MLSNKQNRAEVVPKLIKNEYRPASNFGCSDSGCSNMTIALAVQGENIMA